MERIGDNIYFDDQDHDQFSELPDSIPATDALDVFADICNARSEALFMLRLMLLSGSRYEMSSWSSVKNRFSDLRHLGHRLIDLAAPELVGSLSAVTPATEPALPQRSSSVF